MKGNGIEIYNSTFDFNVAKEGSDILIYPTLSGSFVNYA